MEGKIFDNITAKQRETLANKLNSAGFKIIPLGHISIIEHEKSNVGFLRYHFNEQDGELSYSQSSLSHLEIIPSVYFDKLKEIYNSIK